MPHGRGRLGALRRAGRPVDLALEHEVFADPEVVAGADGDAEAGAR